MKPMDSGEEPRSAPPRSAPLCAPRVHSEKASNEELQSINEELRSTTEELEASREELQYVEDGGKGFGTAILKDQREGRAGFGLFDIRERLRLFDGSLEVDTAPGKGTRATIIAPFRAGIFESKGQREVL